MDNLAGALKAWREVVGAIGAGGVE